MKLVISPSVEDWVLRKTYFEEFWQMVIVWHPHFHHCISKPSESAEEHQKVLKNTPQRYLLVNFIQFESYHLESIKETLSGDT